MVKDRIKKIYRLGMAAIYISLTVFIMTNYSYAQNTKKSSGLNFQVPEDWPIEKRGGIVAPIPTEEYVVNKFKETKEEFQTIRTELTNKLDDLQTNIDNIKLDISKEAQNTEVQTNAQEDSDEETANIMARLNLLDNEVKKINRDISSKVTSIESDLKKTNMLMKSIEKKLATIESNIIKLDDDIEYIYSKQ